MTTAQRFHVPEENLADLKASIAKLNRRAAKLECEPIELAIEFFRIEWRIKLHGEMVWSADERRKNEATSSRNIFAVDATVDTIKLGGWRLIGVLEVITFEAGAETLFHTVPGETIPSEFRSRAGDCDHCKAHRNRKETFVVGHESGETKCVGRQCLRDFLGHDPTRALRHAEWTFSILSELRGFERSEGIGQPIWSLQSVVAFAAASIRVDGWMSASQAWDQHGVPTKSRVRELLEGPGEHSKPSEIKWHKACQPTDKQAIEAELAIEWAIELTEEERENDFLGNLNVLARSGFASAKALGFACALIVAHRRVLEREAEKAAQVADLDEHWGEIKKRASVQVKCLFINIIEGDFGQTGIHKLQTPEGHILTWFASGSTSWLEAGEEFIVKATVKEHDEFRGLKQTVVNRVTVTHEVDPDTGEMFDVKERAKQQAEADKTESAGRKW